MSFLISSTINEIGLQSLTSGKTLYLKLGYRLSDQTNSVRTQVNIDHSQFYDVFSNLSNKQMYEYFVKRKFDIPYIHEYWSRFFNRQIHWEHVYFFIHKTLLDNRVKQFRFKRIHRIIANNKKPI